MVRISEITFLPLGPNEKGFLGLASCVIDDKLKVSGIGVYSALSGGYRLLYPVCQYPHGQTVTVVHPIDRETGRVITKAISSRIDELRGKQGKSQGETYYEPCYD